MIFNVIAYCKLKIKLKNVTVLLSNMDDQQMKSKSKPLTSMDILSFEHLTVIKVCVQAVKCLIETKES